MIVIPKAGSNICKHENVSATFKTVKIWLKAISIAKLNCLKQLKWLIYVLNQLNVTTADSKLNVKDNVIIYLGGNYEVFMLQVPSRNIY